MLASFRQDLTDAESCFLPGDRRRARSARDRSAAIDDEPRALWRDQDRTAEAKQILAAIYGCFTEGQDTHDLEEAAALLAELASCGSDGPTSA
jgi:predicted ATPase